MKILSRLMLASAIAICAALTVPAAAQQTLEFDGWLYGEAADQALAYAQENNVPVAVMNTYRQTTCPLCAGASRTMAASRPTRQMVRVVSYVGAGSDGLNSTGVTALMRGAYGQVTDASNWIPDLYFMMPDGRVIGFVPYEDANKTTDEANTVLQIFEWMDSVPTTVVRADAEAGRGRYTEAMNRIDQIVEQDAQVSHLIQIQVNRAQQGDDMPAQPVMQFFPTLRAEKLAEYSALAMGQLAEARQLFADGDDRGAINILRLLVRGPEAFESTAAAQTLLDEILEARRSQ